MRDRSSIGPLRLDCTGRDTMITALFDVKTEISSSISGSPRGTVTITKQTCPQITHQYSVLAAQCTTDSVAVVGYHLLLYLYLARDIRMTCLAGTGN